MHIRLRRAASAMRIAHFRVDALFRMWPAWYRVELIQPHDFLFPIIQKESIMKNLGSFFAAIFCFALSAIPAHAGGEKCDPPAHKESSASAQGTPFENADANGDGSVSKAEFDAFYSRKNANADKGGRIMQGAPDARQNNARVFFEQRFNAIDTNHDGALDREETNAMPVLKTHFDKVDANRDGKVTQQEYLEAMPMLHRAIGIDSSGKGQVL